MKNLIHPDEMILIGGKNSEHRSIGINLINSKGIFVMKKILMGLLEGKWNNLNKREGRQSEPRLKRWSEDTRRRLVYGRNFVVVRKPST